MKMRNVRPSSDGLGGAEEQGYGYDVSDADKDGLWDWGEGKDVSDNGSEGLEGVSDGSMGNDTGNASEEAHRAVSAGDEATGGHGGADEGVGMRDDWDDMGPRDKDSLWDWGEEHDDTAIGRGRDVDGIPRVKERASGTKVEALVEERVELREPSRSRVSRTRGITGRKAVPLRKEGLVTGITKRMRDMSVAGKCLAGFLVFMLFLNAVGVWVAVTDDYELGGRPYNCVELVQAEARPTSRTGDPDDLQLEYAHLIYSVFSSWGLSDEQCAGMLGSFQKECGIDPTTVEGIYDEPFNPEGPRKSKILDDEEAMSDWTIELLTNPHPKGYGGYLGEDGHVHGASTPGGGLTVYSDFYGPGGPKNLFYPGIGIGSWTGYDQVSAIIGISHSIGRDWWDIDYQIACCLVLPGCGSKGTEIYDRYMSECAGASAADCATWFMSNWEIGPHTLERGFAEEWYARIKSEGWTADRSYANSIISLADQISDSSISERVQKQVLRSCHRAKKFDASTIAKALVTYSYSQNTSFGDGNPGTDLYKQVFEAVAPGDEYFRSCDRAVACAIRWSGADKDFPLGACNTQNEYATQNTTDWLHVCDFQSSGGSPEDILAEAKAAGLEPGDVLFSYGNYHTMAFVGTELVDQIWGEYLSTTGPAPHGAAVNGEGPVPGSGWVDGSIGEDGTPSTYDSGVASGRAPCIGLGGGSSAHTYGVFRYKGDYPYKDEFSDVGMGVSLL